jgi:hypothetical protein
MRLCLTGADAAEAVGQTSISAPGSLINENHDPGAEIRKRSPAAQIMRVDFHLNTLEYATESRVAA